MLFESCMSEIWDTRGTLGPHGMYRFLGCHFSVKIPESG